MNTKFISKLLLLLFFSTAFINNQTKAQGVDVVFWLDNSGSISSQEWSDMTASTRSLIDQVLGCNTNNRVAVVHYAATSGAPPSGSAVIQSRVFIETNFTSVAGTAKGFSRRFSGTSQADPYNDNAHQALASIGNALDGTGASDAQIISSIKNITKTANNKLVIFLFTDAAKWAAPAPIANYSLSALVNTGNTYPYLPITANLYANYNTFKSARGAQFVVIKAPEGNADVDEPEARAACAAIASRGGTYTGTVDANINDPEGGSGTAPRKMVYSSTFTLSATDLAVLKTDICRSCAPVVSVAPTAQSLCRGTAAQPLVATVTATGLIGYQWYSSTANDTLPANRTLITGATAATYSPSTTTAGTFYYYVNASNSDCDGKTNSNVVSVTVKASNAGTAAPMVTSPVSNICDATTVNLTTQAHNSANTPPGASLVWFTNNTHTAPSVADPTAVGTGTFFAFYYDAGTDCYSPASTMVTTSITSCVRAVLTKTLASASIVSGGTTSYTWTITNTSAGSINLTGVGFTDALPAGIVIATMPNIVTNGFTTAPGVTAPAGGGTVTVTNGSIAANSTASITINITNKPGMLNATCPASDFTNGAGNVTGLSSNITNSIAGPCLIVTAACAASTGTLQ